MKIPTSLRLFVRRYGVPAAAGIASFVEDVITTDRDLHVSVPSGPSLLIGVLFAVVVALLVYVLQQRYERKSAELRAFTSEVAHQLRTPLGILKSIGELGLRQKLNIEQYQATIANMLEEVDGLDRLVSALLLLARIDAGRVYINSSPLLISDLVLEVAGTMQVMAEEKSQQFSVEIGEDAVVDADRAMLRQVIMNILDNAIKYTPEGGTISIWTEDRDEHSVEIVVSDDGPGVPPEDRDRIFDRFYRSSEDRSGIGLGLSISKWIVEAHKGTISCDSTPGQGCRVTVHLPTCLQPSLTT